MSKLLTCGVWFLAFLWHSFDTDYGTAPYDTMIISNNLFTMKVGVVRPF